MAQQGIVLPTWRSPRCTGQAPLQLYCGWFWEGQAIKHPCMLDMVCRICGNDTGGLEYFMWLLAPCI